MATKTEKLQFKSYAHSKCIYVGKVPKLKIENLTKKNWSILKHFSLEKYLKLLFSTEFVLNISENQIWKNHQNQKRLK